VHPRHRTDEHAARDGVRGHRHDRPRLRQSRAEIAQEGARRKARAGTSSSGSVGEPWETKIDAGDGDAAVMARGAEDPPISF
jgi:hypothetical protein